MYILSFFNNYKSVIFLGKIGDWKNYYTVAQSEKCDEVIKRGLEGTDIRFLYE